MPSVSAAPHLAAANLSNGHPDTATALKEAPPAGRYAQVITFRCLHYKFGIGAIPVLHLYQAREQMIKLALTLSDRQPELRVAVGTVSHCHGVVATVVFKRGAAPGRE